MSTPKNASNPKGEVVCTHYGNILIHASVIHCSRVLMFGCTMPKPSNPFESVGQCLRNLIDLFFHPESYYSRKQHHQVPHRHISYVKLDKGSLIILCIAIPLAWVFFFVWLFRESLLGEDEDQFMSSQSRALNQKSTNKHSTAPTWFSRATSRTIFGS